nr:PAS domain-containing protein [Burkholderiaceae bacterium]
MSALVHGTGPTAATAAAGDAARRSDCGPPRPRVLIVDDSPEDRELYRLDLAPDFEVIEAAGLSDGLVRWRDDAPDCVLLDQRLPDGDGLELVAAARAAGAADVPVLLLTGVADTALAVEAMKAGCADLLVKSNFTGTELRQALRNSLARATLERQVSAQRAQLAHSVEELERTLVALRASEARLKLGVQVGALALAEVDYLRDEITLSAEAAALYGLADAAGRPLPRSMVHARIHPDDRDTVMAAIVRALDPAGDGTLSLEHRIALPTTAADAPGLSTPAQVRWIAVRKQVSFDAARSRPLSAMLAARDITPRRVSEERARRSEERLRLAHDAAGLGEWTWDVDNEVSNWSPGMFEMHGLPPDAPATYDSLAQVMLPEDLARVQRRIAESLPTGYYTADYRICHPQLGLRWIMGIGRVVERDASGQPRRMTGVALDITERKRMEERLSASEARFVALAQAAPLILYTTDAHGACDFVNARFWEITGLAPHAGPLGLDHLHPDDVALLRAAWRESRARGIQHEHRFRLRVGGSGADTEWRWYLTRALPVRDDSGRVQRWVAVAFDVHEELLREARLQWLVELGDSLVGARDPGAVLAAVSRQVGQQLQVARCGTTQIDRGHRVGCISDDWHRPGLASMAGNFDLAVWGDGITGPLLRGDMMVIRDIASDPRSAPVAATVYAPLGIRAMVSVPLQGDGDAMFQLWVCDDRPRDWTQAELLLLEAAAQRAWLALENARLFSTTREALSERD